MEPEGSLPLLQVPAIYPRSEADETSPYTSFPLPGDPSQYYPPIHHWVFQVISFPQISPPKPCIHLSSYPYVLHVQPFSFFYIWSPE